MNQEVYRQINAMYKKDGNIKRKYCDIADDMQKLYDIDPKFCVSVTCVIRGMCRQQRNKKIFGLNQRHEGTMRMYWLMKNYPKLFYANVKLYLEFGIWRDIVEIIISDYIRNEGNATINSGYLIDLMLKDVAAGRCDAANAFPTIRKDSECTTQRSKMKNVLGKRIRKRMPVVEGKRQNDFYREIKAKYGKLNFKLFKLSNDVSTSVMIERLMQQKILDSIRV